MRLSSTWPVFAAALLACTGSDDGEPRTTVVADGNIARWTVSDRPTLVLEGGGAPTEFSRIVGGAVLPGGELVVADGASAELRVFAPDGRFLRALSREGSGPGELRRLAGLARAGDTLFAVDGMGGAVSAFTLADGYVRQVRRAGGSPFGAPQPLARFSNGSWLVAPGMRVINPPTEPGRIFRDSLRLGVLPPDGDGAPRWLGYFPAATFATYPAPPGAMTQIAASRHPFGPGHASAVSGDLAWIGDTGAEVIVRFDAAGAPVDTIRWPEPTAPLDPKAMDAWRAREAVADASPVGAVRVAAIAEAEPRPAAAPRFAAFVPGVDGAMWVERFRSDDAAPRGYLVLDRAGRPVASVTLPAGMRPLEVGREFVLGVRTDSIGVETVVRHALHRDP